MRELFFILLFFNFFVNGLIAIPVDSLITTYKDGVFTTQYITEIKVSENTAEKVTDRLVSDFHEVTADLFKWALKDLGLQKRANEMIIELESSKHDTKTGITNGLFTIKIPHVRTFRNVKVDAIVTKKVTNGLANVSGTIVYSSLLLENGMANLYILPKNNKLYLYTNSRAKFGWFFNLFITNNRYKSIVEWRVKKFTDNVKEECALIEKK